MAAADDIDMARRLYEEILKWANYFMHSCKNFPMEVLVKKDPTYEEMAHQVDRLSEIILLVSQDFDPMMGSKAFDYCVLMKQMGLAIKNRDEVKLSELVKEMERKPGS